jgi:hypothetical protein
MLCDIAASSTVIMPLERKALDNAIAADQTFHYVKRKDVLTRLGALNAASHPIDTGT